jgi:paraquat-inducible protein B
MKLHLKTVVATVIVTVISLTGCQTAYYATWEKLGKEKRHLLRDNIQKTSKEQEEASEQFKDVLTQIKEIYGFDGGELEDAYNNLKSGYEDSETRAEDVRDRIKKVERIASDLFAEWEQEIEEISNPDFRSKSRERLSETRRRYSRLHQAMVTAEQRMDPVLQQVKDYVLYLKHNLNAQAIGSLRREVEDIEDDVDALIRDMNKSIQEAESFLKDFE